MCGCYDQNVPPDSGLRTVRCCGGFGMWNGRPSGSDYVCTCTSDSSCSDAARSCDPPRDASFGDVPLADTAMSVDAGADATDATEDAP
jgi:hypothetical protein